MTMSTAGRHSEVSCPDNRNIIFAHHPSNVTMLGME